MPSSDDVNPPEIGGLDRGLRSMNPAETPLGGRDGEAWWRTFDAILAMPVASLGHYPAEEWCP